ncbi:MAG: hypothetical protein J6Z11_08000, partial [Candidatus Riflebacteria bacterium]|nr:hypothetical protein [Candidatus Riflebacteria bacterium]
FVVEFAKTHKGESYKFRDTKDNLYDEQYVPGHNIDRKPCSWTIMHKGALCGFIVQNRIGFTTNNLKSILAENRFSFSPVISEWLKNGWLEKETTTGNNPQFKCKESKYRCITINQLGISVAEEKSSKVE